jgi:hypothetical protein
VRPVMSPSTSMPRITGTLNVHLKLQQMNSEQQVHVHLQTLQTNVHMTLPWMNVHRVLHLHGLSGTIRGET